MSNNIKRRSQSAGGMNFRRKKRKSIPRIGAAKPHTFPDIKPKPIKMPIQAPKNIDVPMISPDLIPEGYEQHWSEDLEMYLLRPKRNEVVEFRPYN